MAPGSNRRSGRAPTPTRAPTPSRPAAGTRRRDGSSDGRCGTCDVSAGCCAAAGRRDRERTRGLSAIAAPGGASGMDQGSVPRAP